MWKMRAPTKVLTLLDLWDPSYDRPNWRPRGSKVFNGIRQRGVMGIRL